MHSYIDIHHFAPSPEYRTISNITKLIDDALFEQNALDLVGKSDFASFRQNVIDAMKIYYQLVGIDDEVIAACGAREPQGVLPKFTKCLIDYFRSLEDIFPFNKEIETLKYSGLTTIKIRYKYTNSVIKKLVKLGLRDKSIFEKPLDIFLKGGAMHDLIGILFVCSYPNEKEWIARALYNFFEYSHRTDDHLVYGFYTVKKISGYQGLHCDDTLFNPRFDRQFSSVSGTYNIAKEDLLSLEIGQMDCWEILSNFKKFFNIEIQIHTTFENLWSTMEHTKSYNVHAKGIGRKSEITVQWKLLSDTMHNLEQQFERLQIDTEQARFISATRRGYTFVNEILKFANAELYPSYKISNDKVVNLDNLLKSHEISRQEYVQKLYKESKHIYEMAYLQTDLTTKAIFLLHSAYIYYGLTTYQEYFNSQDIQLFVQKAKELYIEIHLLIEQHPQLLKARLLNIVAIVRYLNLEHKHDLGLIYVQSDNYEQKLDFFSKGIMLLNELNSDDLHYLKEDNASYLKIIQAFDTFARDWELVPTFDSKSLELAEAIRKFRARYVNVTLEIHFQMLLDNSKITNVGLVVKFYTTLIWHGIIVPMQGLKQIIKYSAYDRIQVSDLFHYELAAYRFLVICSGPEGKNFCLDKSHIEQDPIRISHLKNYHKENMIQQLFRIKRTESSAEFQKARLNFEQMTGEAFRLNHFSDELSHRLRDEAPQSDSS